MKNINHTNQTQFGNDIQLKNNLENKFFIICLIVFLFSCSKNELFFDVDSTLLGERYQNKVLGIELKIPINWNKISDKEFLILKEKLKKENLEGLNLLQIYFNRKNQSSSIISVFTNEEKMENIIKNYNKRLSVFYPNAKILYSNFYKKDVKFYQFHITANNFINIKLLFLNNNENVIQVDYTISNKYYKNELKPIESSIGSIEKLYK